ncbi:MAG: UDP-N-acetylmuramate dehydrogenase [Planctomycetaceae bacterium]
MSSLSDFAEITRADVPLAPLTWLKVGGPAQMFVEPRSAEELQGVILACFNEGIPVHMLGGGSNLLVRDDGVSGVVIRLSGEPFEFVEVKGNVVRAGSGALLSNVISHAVAAGLAGMETLVGIPGTVGGALRGNAGSRSGDIGSVTTAVTVITGMGECFIRTGEELSFQYRDSSINELAVVEAEFTLHAGDPEAISQRMRKQWIMKKSSQPLAFQSAGCVFKNPRSLSAGALIEQAGLKGTRIGGCEVSDRHANFVVTHTGATAKDVLQLIDLIRAKVAEAHGVELELELQVW